ncbi:unnamed protein product, partial [marine sediment metagenome]
MTSDIKKTWMAEIIDCPSTTAAALICIIHGGESATLKSLATAGEFHYIGPNRNVNALHGYLMDAGDTVTIGLPIDFGTDNIIEVWALPTTAGD